MIINEISSFSTKLSEEEAIFILLEAWLHTGTRQLHLVFLILEWQMLRVETSFCSQDQKGIHGVPS